MKEQIKIIIHRGTHQIGGCATEIEYADGRILIDLGANLPETNKSASICDRKLLDHVFGVRKNRHFDAILFTHYHGDHLGLYKDIPAGIPMYIGKTAKEIFNITTDYIDLNTAQKGRKLVEKMSEYTKGRPIDILQKIKVTPFSVDHSALDSYMFLIEAGDKKILFTGDFRDHGIACERDQFWRVIEKYVGKNIDIIITEGTMLSRTDEVTKKLVISELELGKKAAALFNEKKYNFVMVSSTNLDSIMEFYQNTPDDKLFICDQYQAKIMLSAMEGMGNEFLQYRSKREALGLYKKICIIGNVNNYVYRDLQKRGEKIRNHGLPQVYFKKIDISKIDDKGFVLLVRPNRFFAQTGYNKFESLFKYYRDSSADEVNLIYSMWKGYLSGDTTDTDIVRFIGELGGWNYHLLHTSGHAYVDTIKRLLETVNPTTIIPMHTEMADKISSMKPFSSYKNNIHVLNDGEMFVL